VTICTFHALGLKFLQIEHAAVGLKRGFSIFDADDAAAQIKDLMYGAKPDDIEDMKNLVSRAKNAGLSPEQAMAAARSNREKEAASVYERYQLRLTAFNAVDFDDLIRLPVQILEENPEIALAWRERIGYLLVDECQDTNDAQYRLLKQLAGEKGNFTCVGDDDQSIYAWRGANPENLQQMGRDYPAGNHQAGAELPLLQPRAARGQCADRQQPARAPEEAVERPGRRRTHPRVGMPQQRT
jgi:ATP-dependent DNA helicase Rep